MGKSSAIRWAYSSDFLARKSSSLLGDAEVGEGQADAGVGHLVNSAKVIDEGHGLLVAHVEARHAQDRNLAELVGVAQELEQPARLRLFSLAQQGRRQSGTSVGIVVQAGRLAIDQERHQQLGEGPSVGIDPERNLVPGHLEVVGSCDVVGSRAQLVRVRQVADILGPLGECRARTRRMVRLSSSLAGGRAKVARSASFWVGIA